MAKLPITDMTIREQFLTFMARTLFVQAWADWVEQYGDHYPGGTELFDAAPETPNYVFEAAVRLLAIYEDKLAPLDVILARAEPTWHRSGRGDFIDDLAYCLTMQALGHGVGWKDYCDDFEGLDADVNFDFTYFDLDDDLCPIPEEPDNDN